MKHFYINDVKYNYDLEFINNSKHNFWKQNTPLIEYCETLGINIPHYCYHKGLSISGNCRMCLIELKNSAKPIISCAINAKSCLTNGDIYTNSPLVKKARENILEFLLLNHPLDCPVCDQSGECDLQDQSFFFGVTKKRFYNFKRVVIDKNIGPIIKTVMTRCIHCTRCVRFADEIAGISDIGMFGRGLQSEIGTYIENIFQSELSGNAIDLCPVGALTSKPYPFVSRNWELKSVESIDFSDGFGTPIQLYIKNNKIVKILPSYEKISFETNWISDKTRFSFDGMFSPERITYNFIKNNNKKLIIGLSWKKLFKEFFYTIYFKKQLSKHLYQPYPMLICLNKDLSLEVLNLLYILSHKYSFFKLRQIESQNVNIDFEQNYLLDSNLNHSTLSMSDTCFLLGTNTRYEGSKLNLLLRSRYLQGNFKIIQVGSLSKLTIPTYTFSSNTEVLKSIVQGNNLLCQNFTNSSNPITIINSNIFKREDSFAFTSMLKLFIKYLSIYSQSYMPNSLNILNSTLNDAGFNHFTNLKTLQNKDFKNCIGIYFLKNSFSSYHIKKLLNLKILNYFHDYKRISRLLITQNNTIETKKITTLKNGFNLCNHIHLPNTVFFETSGTYINTKGNINKLTKIIAAPGQTKNDWQILRKILFYCKNAIFIENFFNENKTIFNCNTLYSLKNYTTFQYYPTPNLNSLTSQRLKKVITYNIQFCSFKITQKKILQSQLRFWLNDFYLDGKDFSSKYSSTMIQCSKFSRLKHTNFKF